MPYKNAIQIELWMNSGLLGIHYERTLAHALNWRGIGRAGLGSDHFHNAERRFDPDLFIPVGMYFCVGRKAQAEVGGGGAILSTLEFDASSQGTRRMQEVLPWCSAGMRAGEPTSRLFARAAFTWVFRTERIQLDVGLGLGYRF